MSYIKEGFNPVFEANFLKRLVPAVRGRVLESEIRTAAYEAFLVKFRKDYQWREGRIYDEESGLYISDLTENGDRPEEVRAMTAIESGLAAGKMVVNFSPRNEKYKYPDNCVDFWKRDGEKITWLRFVTKDEYEDFLEVWKDLGGEGEVSDEFELLAKPVTTEEKLTDILARLDFAKESGEATKEEIDIAVANLTAEFRWEFGEEEILTPEKILRLFSAVMTETKKTGKRELGVYLHGSMVVTRMATGGCSGFNMIGEFGSGQGYFVVEGSGGMKVMKGMVPEGYRFCKKCGVWYSGQKCPFCD